LQNATRELLPPNSMRRKKIWIDASQPSQNIHAFLKSSWCALAPQYTATRSRREFVQRAKLCASIATPEINMNRLTKFFTVLLFATSATFAVAQDKVVYHIDNAAAQGLKGLRNIRNHMDVAPTTQITVVTHADGVDMLMEGAKEEKSKTEYAPLVSALKARGVKFEICEITLKNRNLKKEQFILDADFTPSGVARIGQLQTRERFAYIKP
jgi:hypothetical protein